MAATPTIQYAFSRHVAVQNQGLNIGAVYNVMTTSPCKKRPDTGKKCYLINEDKNSKECRECIFLGNVAQKIYTATHKKTERKVQPKKIVKRNRINGTCGMKGCNLPAQRIFADYGIFCEGHRSTVRNRVQRAIKKGKILTVAEATVIPDYKFSRSQRGKK